MSWTRDRSVTITQVQALRSCRNVGVAVPKTMIDAAMDYLMRKEGVLLDPIYSGKTFAGLMDLVKTGEICGRVLFWHTGGLPTLFAGG
ncbi:MAG: hypothetical protein IH945_00005 [Armatimonadetes bacterium]|nr:hypothetical protein [Armatimonadota bacterium]